MTSVSIHLTGARIDEQIGNVQIWDATACSPARRPYMSVELGDGCPMFLEIEPLDRLVEALMSRRNELAEATRVWDAAVNAAKSEVA